MSEAEQEKMLSELKTTNINLQETLKDANIRLQNEEERCKALRRANEHLRYKLLSSGPASHDFTKEELKVMRIKLHPDKNDGSEICNSITQKLNKMKL